MAAPALAPLFSFLFTLWEDAMKKYPVFAEYALIIAGAFIVGFAIKNMYDPINLVTGGV